MIYRIRSLTSDPSSKYLKLTFEDRIFSILVDSGSQPPLLINSKLISQLKLCTTSIQPIHLKSFDDTLVERIEESTVPVIFNSWDDEGRMQQFCESFLVSRNMHVDFILGLPFCKQHGFVWDFARDSIHFSTDLSIMDSKYRNQKERSSMNSKVSTVSVRTEDISTIPGISQLGDLSELEAVFDVNRVNQLPEISDWALKINLVPSAILKAHRPYKHSAEEEASLQEEVTKGLNSGRLLRSTASNSSPVLFVKVPGKASRMCVDYRHLNSQTISEPAVLPNIQDLLDKLPPNFIYLSKIVFIKCACIRTQRISLLLFAVWVHSNTELCLSG